MVDGHELVTGHIWQIDPEMPGWGQCKLCHDCNDPGCCVPRYLCPGYPDHDARAFGWLKVRWLKFRLWLGRR